MKPYRNKKHIQWVKQLPCVVCDYPADDAHHLVGHGLSGMGTKVSDLYTFPLCRQHHEELHQHGYKEWEYINGSQWKHITRTLERSFLESAGYVPGNYEYGLSA